MTSRTTKATKYAMCLRWTSVDSIGKHFLKSDSAFNEPVIHCHFSHFAPNDRYLLGLSLIPSVPTQKLLWCLKISPLHTLQSSYELFSYWNICIKASYPKWTHFIVVARVSMLMLDDIILQNLLDALSRVALFNILKLKLWWMLIMYFGLFWRYLIKRKSTD